jgi:hypothetical protein
MNKMKSLKANGRWGSRLERVMGILLLIPPVIGAAVFVTQLIFGGSYQIPHTEQLADGLLGKFYGGQPTPTAPIYLGLMAIAGAILLKWTDDR